MNGPNGITVGSSISPESRGMFNCWTYPGLFLCLMKYNNSHLVQVNNSPMSLAFESGA